MVIWLFHQLGVPIGHSVGAKIPWAPMGQLMPHCEYFVYECDEFDRNFLSFHPYMSLITGVGWDHHEIFPTREEYNGAFMDFLKQSENAVVWQTDTKTLGLTEGEHMHILREDDPQVTSIALAGETNRKDAWQAVMAVHLLTGSSTDTLKQHIANFPGLKQRMELLAPNLYTNYAHTPEKIKGGLSAAFEMATQNNQQVVVIYEPLTNRRQHYIKHEYKDSFKGSEKVHWVRTYLAREDPDLPLLSPAELIQHLDDPSIAEPTEMDDALIKTIRNYLKEGKMVVAVGASGAGSLDEWLRGHLSEITD
jgi:UDP-N-acetylmuramate--alanine ligase